MVEAYDVERLKTLLESQAWAKDWPHSIVPSGKPAHELACEAIRALPALLARIAELEKGLREIGVAAQLVAALSDDEDEAAPWRMIEARARATLERAQAEGEGK